MLRRASLIDLGKIPVSDLFNGRIIHVTYMKNKILGLAIYIFFLMRPDAGAYINDLNDFIGATNPIIPLVHTHSLTPPLSVAIQPHSAPLEVQRRADSITHERSRSFSGDFSTEALQDCVICLNEFTTDDQVIDTCGGHTFHSECLKTHFETSYERKIILRPNAAMEPFKFQCPLCKRELEI